MCVIIFLKLNNAFEGDGFSSYLRHVWLFLLHASFLLTYCRTVAHAIWLQFDMDTSMFKQMKPQNKIGYTMLCFALLEYHAFTYQRSGAYNDNRKNDRAHVKYTRIEQRARKTCRIQISSPEYIACKWCLRISNPSYLHLTSCAFLCIYFGLDLFSHSPKLFLCRGRSPKWQCDTPSVQVICMHFITDLKYKLDSIWFTAEMVSILIYLCWPRSSLKWYTIER